MRAARTDRLWMIGGALGAVVLLVIGWLFFVSPKNRQTTSLHGQTDTAQLRIATLQHQLADLRQQNRDLPQYRARLARDRQALPTTSELSNFLRELQTVGDSTGVSVSGLLIGSPTQVTGMSTKVYALPITLTAAGTAATLDQFLHQLQQVQPRAVQINSANAVPADETGTLAGTVTLTLSLQAFVAQAGSVGTAQAPTTTN